MTTRARRGRTDGPTSMTTKAEPGLSISGRKMQERRDIENLVRSISQKSPSQRAAMRKQLAEAGIDFAALRKLVAKRSR